MSFPTFIGLDLAWSERNPSALAHLQFDGKAATLLNTAYFWPDEEMLDWIEARSRGGVWIGIDAPIIAPNPPQSCRLADRLVSSAFGRFHAGVYPGNSDRCARPIRLSRTLAAKGFSADPYLPARADRRQLEIFPHLVQIALLGRQRIIKYKKGSRQQKIGGLRILQEALAEHLPRQSPPLLYSPALRELLGEDPQGLRGRKLKELEDKLDALLCGYMTIYFWLWGEERCSIFGDLESGYIIGPKLNNIMFDVQSLKS